MTRSGIMFIVAALLLAPFGGVQTPAAQSSASSSDLIELDIVVTDKDGQIISDLRQDEFQIDDDGKRVEVKSFTPVTVTSGRSVIIVLDDAGVPMAGTQPIQNLANIFLSAAGSADTVSVVRLHEAGDTPSADRAVAMARINGFQAGKIPYETTQTPQVMMRLTARLADQLRQPEHRRKAIVCIGSPGVCNIEARSSGSPRDTYPTWVAAVSALARANTSVYAMIPLRMNLVPGGLTDLTGGTAFLGQNDFAQSAAQIWRELSQYYLIGYAPQASSKDLRKLVVKVARKGAIVHTRGVRGGK